MGNKKAKYKNNRRAVSPVKELGRLEKEQRVLQGLTTGIILGNADDLYPTIFPKLRALICSGSWAMNPLLQRVYKQHNFTLKFYATSQPENKKTLNKVTLSKQWLSKPTSEVYQATSLDEYLNQTAYYNSFEDRFITRNELIRLFADGDGSHFDPEEDLFADWLEKSKASFGKNSISQKELFMWDIYMLVDWHINHLLIELDYRTLSKQVGFSAVKHKLNETNRINQHYDSQLQKTILAFSTLGERLCKKCKIGNLEKVSKTVLKCKTCGYNHEL